jgi:hypothetical protein
MAEAVISKRVIGRWNGSISRLRSVSIRRVLF